MRIATNKLAAMMMAGVVLTPFSAWADEYRCPDGKIVTINQCPDGSIPSIIAPEITPLPDVDIKPLPEPEAIKPLPEPEVRPYTPPAPSPQPVAEPAPVNAAPVAQAPEPAPQPPAPPKKINFVGSWTMWGYQFTGGTTVYGTLTVARNNTYKYNGGKGAYRVANNVLTFTSGPLAPNTVEAVHNNDCCQMVWQHKNYQNWVMTRK